MIAGLPMYDRQELQTEQDFFWSKLRSNLGFGPESLTKPDNIVNFWQRSDLVFGQTCGMPYRTFLHDKVKLIGTPDYGIAGCSSGHYRSAVIVHRDSKLHQLGDLANTTIAYNEPLSQSGWAAVVSEMEEAGLKPTAGLQTHAHANSAIAVSTRKADFAAIDAHTWRLLLTYQTELTNKLRVVHWTTPTPGLPFICAERFDTDELFVAVQNTLGDMSRVDLNKLGLCGIVKIPKQHYLNILSPSSPCNLFGHA